MRGQMFGVQGECGVEVALRFANVLMFLCADWLAVDRSPEVWSMY